MYKRSHYDENGQPRDKYMSFRTTQVRGAKITKLAKKMKISIAQLVEIAVTEYIERKK